jgi:hypothetical protein
MTRVALLLHASHVFIQYYGDYHARRAWPGDVAGDVPKWVASVTTTRTRPLPVGYAPQTPKYFLKGGL